MKISAAAMAQAAQPGNFLMVRVSTGWDPLLRRPLGILKVAPPHLWLYFQLVGKGTRLLANFRAGDSITLLGPLGNAFPQLQQERILLVAGGRGIVPLFFYASRFSGSNSVWLIYGAKTMADLHLLAEIEQFPLQRLLLYSDDGSQGERGLASDGVLEMVKEQGIRYVFSCGPEALLRSVERLMAPLSVAHYASLEAYMGCGFGVCLSCVVKGSDGLYLKVCSEGPVFAARQIQW